MFQFFATISSRPTVVGNSSSAMKVYAGLSDSSAVNGNVQNANPPDCVRKGDPTRATLTIIPAASLMTTWAAGTTSGTPQLRAVREFAKTTPPLSWCFGSVVVVTATGAA